MNSDIICLRIFFVLFIAVWGGLLAFVYGARIITPVALCMMDTNSTEGEFMNQNVFVEVMRDSDHMLFQSMISYVGRTGVLFTTSPPLAVRKEPTETDVKTETDHVARDFFGQPIGRSAKPLPPPLATIAVRYVRAFPALVARDTPRTTIWDYYADIWTRWEFIPFAIQSALLGLVCILFRRHLKRSRLRTQW